MCDHCFQVLTLRRGVATFFCERCLQIEVRTIDIQSVPLIPFTPPDDEIPEEAPGQFEEDWQDYKRALRQGVLDQADQVAAAIGRALRGDPEWPPRLLPQLAGRAADVLRLFPRVRLVAEIDGEVLLAARSAALDRLAQQPQE